MQSGGSDSDLSEAIGEGFTVGNVDSKDYRMAIVSQPEPVIDCVTHQLDACFRQFFRLIVTPANLNAAQIRRRPAPVFARREIALRNQLPDAGYMLYLGEKVPKAPASQAGRGRRVAVYTGLGCIVMQDLEDLRRD